APYQHQLIDQLGTADGELKRVAAAQRAPDEACLLDAEHLHQLLEELPALDLMFVSREHGVRFAEVRHVDCKATVASPRNRANVRVKVAPSTGSGSTTV